MRMEAPPPAAPVNTGPVQPTSCSCFHAIASLSSCTGAETAPRAPPPQSPVSLPPTPPTVSKPPPASKQAFLQQSHSPKEFSHQLVHITTKKLDDLFRKTKATPRIYCLTLSDVVHSNSDCILVNFIFSYFTQAFYQTVYIQP